MEERNDEKKAGEDIYIRLDKEDINELLENPNVFWIHIGHIHIMYEED